MRSAPLAFTFTVAFVLAVGSADAATLFVDGGSASCSDGATYVAAQSEATPFCTIQPAADVVNAGDTVRVKAGQYPESTYLYVNRGGTAGQPVTFQPYGDGTVTIVGPPATASPDDAGVVIYAEHVVFEGFEITGSGSTGLRNGKSNVTLRGNYVHDNARGCSASTKCGQGIASNTAGTTGVVIENNFSARNGTGTSLDHGFYVSGQGVVVRNNIAMDCAGWGFQIYPDCDDCDVYNNVSFGNANQSGFVLGGEESEVPAKLSSNMRVYNNIAVGNGRAGFLLYENGSGDIALVNNLAFGNPDGAVDTTNASIAFTDVGMIELDPLLVDAAGGDFHLQAASPAVDAGDPTLVAPFDIDGQVRPMGAGVDIGADELGQGGGSGSATATAAAGATSGSGGALGTGSGSGGSSSSGSASDDGSGTEGEGCDCRVSAPRGSPSAVGWFLLALLRLRRARR